MTSPGSDTSGTNLPSTPSSSVVSFRTGSDLDVNATTVVKRYNPTFRFRAIVYEVCQRAGPLEDDQEERVLFSVPVYGQSCILAEEFRGRFPDHPEGIGSSAAQPLRVDGVEEAEFCAILKAIYPPPGQTPGLLPHEWFSVLKLAQQWGLPKLREKALSCSSEIARGWDPVKKITSGKKYNVLQWCVEGYKDIAIRNGRISKSEKNELGLESYVRLLELRDCVWAWVAASPKAKKGSRSKSSFDINTAICEVFEDEQAIVQLVRPSGNVHDSSSSRQTLSLVSEEIPDTLE